MPKIIIHAPQAAFDAISRQAIAAELTELALDCEGLPGSPFVRSLVWTYFNLYPSDTVFMGAEPATRTVVSMQVFAMQGGFCGSAKDKFFAGATDALGRYWAAGNPLPVHIVIHEVAEADWGMFGARGNLAALQASAPDASAL
jgi:phenylpyruvate tautomerase PptA (4-oxalocrotonate tautomerase family)